jgi:outer membrane immunogenic protein
VSKNRVSVGVLLASIVFGSVGALADEMTAAPAIVIDRTGSEYNWTGVYIGVNGGYAWSQAGISYSPNDPAAQAGTCGGGGAPRGQCIPSLGDLRQPGPLAGGQVGFNWQISRLWMTGVEADYQWAHLAGTGMSPFRLGNVGATDVIADQSVNSFGTLRARMGVAPIAPVLFYGTGGLAFGQVGDSYNIPSPRTGTLAAGGFSYSCGAAGTNCFAGSSSKMVIGWTVGGGGELALTPRLTFKAEVLYVNLAAPQATITAQAATVGTTPSSFSASVLSPVGFIVARGGLNFKF